jgi:hypothetical protein
VNEAGTTGPLPDTSHFLPVFAGAFLAGAFAAACGLESGFAVTVFLAEDGGAGAFLGALFGAGLLSDVWVSADALTALISRGVRDFGALSPFDAIAAVFGVVFSVLTISNSPLES